MDEGPAPRAEIGRRAASGAVARAGADGVVAPVADAARYAGSAERSSVRRVREGTLAT